MRLPSVLAIGFLGRQTEHEETSAAPLQEALRQRLQSASGFVYGICALAPGEDLLFAEACIELGISVQLLMPMREEELVTAFATDLWPRARTVMERALSREPVDSQHLLESGYYECQVEIMQRGGLLLALGAKGEALDAMTQFAVDIGKPLLRVNSVTGKVEVHNRDAERKLARDPELDFLNHLSDCNVAPAATDDATEIAQRWFKKIDNYASEKAPQVRRLAGVPILYTAAAALISGIASKASATHHNLGLGWIVVGTALGFSSTVVPTVLRLDQRQALWARTRIPAEVCRSVLALWDAPFESEVIGPEVASELTGMLTSFRWLKMRALAGKSVTLEAFKARYLKERVIDQKMYYLRQVEKARLRNRKYKHLTYYSIGAAVLLVIAWLISWLIHKPHQGFVGTQWLGLCLSTLFQGATIATALQIVNDSERRERRYQELHDWLRDWERQLTGLRTWSSVLKIAVQVEKALMVELLEWRSLAMNTKLSRK